MPDVLKNHYQTLTTWALVACLFAIPISPSLKSIFLPIALGLILLSQADYPLLRISLKQPYSRMAILFFIYIVMACAWSPASFKVQAIFVEKYSKLLFLPLLVVGYTSPKARRYSLGAFVIAMTLTAILSLMKHTGDPGEVFHNHIVTGNMMAIACFIVLTQMTKEHGKMRLLLGGLAVLLSYQVLFINTGRTGYIIYFALMSLFLGLSLKPRHLMPALMLFAAVFIVIVYNSPVIQSGIQQGLQDWHAYKTQGVGVSLGYRLIFQHFAKSLFLSSPIWGHGVGGFYEAYHQINTDPAWDRLLDPHSQYWLIAADLGAVGLLLFAAFFVSLLVQVRYLTEQKNILLASLLAFALCNLSDAQLLYSSMGNLFILLFSICLGERIEQLKAVPPFSIDTVKDHALQTP